VASLHHQAFLVYLLPKAEVIDEIDPGPFEQTMPGLTMATTKGFKTRSGDIRFRKSPFSTRNKYSTGDLEEYIRHIVTSAELTLHRFCDLTRYHDTNDTGLDAQGSVVPVVDLGFARNTLLTLFVLVRRSITNTFKSDTFDRMSTFYDIVDLHASLIHTDPHKAAAEFRRLVHRDYALGSLTEKLKLYPGLVGTDIVDGLAEIRDASTKVVLGGVLDGLSGTHITVPKRSKKGAVTTSVFSLDDFEAHLLRALRNTKHGYEN
jgi:hypothetical protein